MRLDFTAASADDRYEPTAELDMLYERGQPAPLRRMNQTIGLELYRLHQACAERYWWASQPVVDRLVALDIEETHKQGLRLDERGLLVRPMPTHVMKQLRHLMEVRQMACFRPYLERVAHVRGLSYRAVLAELRAMAVPPRETR